MRRCRIFLHELSAHHQARLRAQADMSAATASRLQRELGDWAFDQMASEQFIVASLRSHAWRVATAQNADVVLVVTNRSRLCDVLSRTPPGPQAWSLARYSELLWDAALSSALAATRKRSVVRLVSLQNARCGEPHAGEPQAAVRAGLRLDSVLRLVETVPSSQMGSQRTKLLYQPTPFVVPRHSVAWRTALATARTPWASRKLLLFAGHVPKLYLSTTRYRLWRQLHDDPRVTTQSHSINCTVGAFDGVCSRSLTWLRRNTSTAFFEGGFCRDACRDTVSGRSEGPCGFGWPADEAHVAPAQRVERYAMRMHKKVCPKYRKYVNFTSVRGAIRRDASRRWSHAEYLRQALAHRFCLVAMGDAAGTPKITEMAVLGGLGGCIPVFVIGHDGSAEQLARSFPYVATIDYCTLSYLAPADVAVSGRSMARLLERLEAVTPEEAATKREALRRASDAFSLVDATGSSSPATEHVLAEACDRARLLRQLLPDGRARTPQKGRNAHGNSSALGLEAHGADTLAGSRDHRRCMLLP